jgi:hypothetical protein
MIKKENLKDNTKKVVCVGRINNWEQKVSTYLEQLVEHTDEDTCEGYIYGELKKGSKVSDILKDFCNGGNNCFENGRCMLYDTLMGLKNGKCISIKLVVPSDTDLEQLKLDLYSIGFDGDIKIDVVVE